MSTAPRRAGQRTPIGSWPQARLLPISEGGLQDIGLMRNLRAIECDPHRFDIFSSIPISITVRQQQTTTFGALGRRLATWLRRRLDTFRMG
jgi:hypothetical protein